VINKVISILTLLCFSLVCEAQVISSLSVSEDTIFIGDEISVYYKLISPKNIAVRGLNFSVLDSLDSLTPTSSADTSSIPYYAEIEWQASFMNYEKKLIPYHLTKKIDQGTKYEYRDTFKATFWDLGFYELLHPHILFDTSAQDQRIMRLETPTVFVSPPLIQNPDTTSVLLPIKDIIKTKRSWWDDYKYFLYFLLPVFLGLGLLYLYSRTKNKEQQIVYVAPPKEAAHVIALRKLEALATQQDWKKGKVKTYQSELTYTIREYLENRYEIKALESTTGEISRALAQNNFDASHEKDLIEILQIADLVKFAKAQPTEDINEVFLEKAKSFVQDTKAITSLTESDTDAG